MPFFGKRVQPSGLRGRQVNVERLTGAAHLLALLFLRSPASSIHVYTRKDSRKSTIGRRFFRADLQLWLRLSCSPCIRHPPSRFLGVNADTLLSVSFPIYNRIGMDLRCSSMRGWRRPRRRSGRQRLSPAAVLACGCGRIHRRGLSRPRPRAWSRTPSTPTHTMRIPRGLDARLWPMARYARPPGRI